MRIFVIGGHGFIGTAVRAEFSQSRHEVVAPSKGEYDLLLDDIPEGFDAIVQLAWTLGLDSPGNSAYLSASMRLLESSAPVYFAGSYFEYFGQNAYSAAKRRLSELAGEHTVLRYFQTYGPNEKPHRLIPSALRGETIRNADQKLDFIHVTDAARATVFAVENRLKGAFDVGSGTLTSVETIARLVNPSCPLKHGADRPEITAKSIEGFSCRYDIDSGVAATLAESVSMIES